MALNSATAIANFNKSLTSLWFFSLILILCVCVCALDSARFFSYRSRREFTYHKNIHIATVAITFHCHLE